ncbi:MAG: PLP-dependent aminotransferase family protein [Lautropia sp.]
MALPDFQGLAALRQTIANRMSLLRGFSCSADQIFLTGGLHGAITLAAITLLRESDMVWVEDPGCDRVRDLLSMLRMTLLPVPVDRYGVDVGAGVKAGTDARLAVVTPCYQFPLGVMLSQQRRRALADWARSSDAWILEYEDDVDFHFTGNPAPPLKAHDGAVRVLHAGAFGKALFPGLNLGYLVVPPALARRFDASSRALQIRTSVINQQVVMDFVHQGHIGRHLNRMRKLYLDRRTALVRELSRHFAPPCRIQVLPGGLHVILWLDKRCDDTDVADRAAVIGLAPYPLSRLTVRSTHPPALLLGFANETDQSLPANVAALAAIVSAKRRRPT